MCVCVCVCVCVCKPYFPPEHLLFNAYILQYSVKIVIVFRNVSLAKAY